MDSRFTRQQKFDTVCQIRRGERTQTAAAKELGVSLSTVKTWCNQVDLLGSRAFRHTDEGDTPTGADPEASVHQRLTALEVDMATVTKELRRLGAELGYRPD